MSREIESASPAIPQPLSKASPYPGTLLPLRQLSISILPTSRMSTTLQLMVRLHFSLRWNAIGVLQCWTGRYACGCEGWHWVLNFTNSCSLTNSFVLGMVLVALILHEEKPSWLVILICADGTREECRFTIEAKVYSWSTLQITGGKIRCVKA